MGARLINRLNADAVRQITERGLHPDGDGLYLQVKGETNRSWIFRYMKSGTPRWMGLGPVRLVSLSKARVKVKALRLQLLEGVDPLEARVIRKAKDAADAASALTFKEAAKRYIAAHEGSWKNEKHRQQWQNTLDTYAMLTLGKVSTRKIDTGMVMKVIEPLWSEKPETASRLRGRIETVLDYAKVNHWREGDNPARWKGHLENLLPARSKVRKVRHQPALPWKRIGAFMAELRTQNGTGSKALDFTILTAARTTEVIEARWPEIDLDEKVWTVPAGRMKAEREHRVPLCDAAISILKGLLPLRDIDAGDWIFPGGRSGKPMSNAAMSAVIDRMNEGDAPRWVDPKQDGRPVTVHGMRSTFRDWLGEATNHPEELGEACLAHVIKNKAQAAYERGDKFERRRVVMADWEDFCAVVQPNGAAK